MFTIMVAYLVDVKMMVALLLLMTTILNVDGYEDPFRIGLGLGRSLLRRCKTDHDCIESLGQRWRCLGRTCQLRINKRRDIQPRGI